MRENLIKDSISKAINFLYKNQLDYGEFKTYRRMLPWKLRYFESSPFITALVLYSLKDIKNEKVRTITDKAINFLLSEQEQGGIWRFWTSRFKKHIPPDLDDISVISLVLKLKSVNFGDNSKLIWSNKNKDNLFYTWIIKEEDSHYWMPGLYKKDVDYVVNVNVLLYLGKNDPFVCRWVNKAIRDKKLWSRYYLSELAMFYMVSRAFQNNVTCLAENRNQIIESSLNYQKKNGSFGNDLETAFALNTLFNFGYLGKEIDLGIDYLLQNQAVDGSWKRSFFFGYYIPFTCYYGSEALTTALAIEAMKNYLEIL